MTRKKERIVTTLFDLFEAINSEVRVGEEGLVLPILLHLIRTGRVRFIRNSRISGAL